MKTISTALLCLTCVLGVGSKSGLAQTQLPANATLYASGLNGPRGLIFEPDGTLYVAEAGSGGTNPSGTVCQVVPPIGPYLGGTTARISAIDATGTRTTVASGLPSAMAATGDLYGVADLAFLDGKLYALITGGGCSHGNPNLPNGIVKVNPKNGNWNYITDLSLFYFEHPVANPDPADFEPDGVPYSLIADHNRLIAVEPNHGQVTATTADGATTQIIDLSFSEGHIVPTSVLAADNNLYLGNLGLFPVQQTWARVITLSKDLGLIDTIPGLETKPADLNKFRVASSRAGFTTIVGLKLGPDGLLYALELSDAPGFPAPGMGKIVRIDQDGSRKEVVTGLSVPTGMTFGPDNALYVSNFGAAPAGSGQILRITLP